MRRATAALLGTVAGTALLVGAKYGTTSAIGVGAVAGAVTDVADPATPTPEVTPRPAASRWKSAAPTPGRTTPSSRRSSVAAPVTSAAPRCVTSAGGAAAVSRPGVGAVTVTIKVCGGAVSTASGTLSRSNWDRNTRAIPALDAMAVKYYKTGISQIHYSGASLTSAAYQASLRSALSTAGI